MADNNLTNDGGTLVVSGGSYATLDLADYTAVIVTGNATVDSWSNGSGKVLTIKNDATLTTGSWGGMLVTVDLQGSTATGLKPVKAIDYTGNDTLTLGKVTIVNGGTAGGGYVFDNDLYVGNHIYYNNCEWDLDNLPATVTINGAEFDLTSTNSFNLSGTTSGHSETSGQKRPYSDLYWQTYTEWYQKGIPSAFVITGSGYTVHHKSNSVNRLHGNIIFYNATYTDVCADATVTLNGARADGGSIQNLVVNAKIYATHAAAKAAYSTSAIYVIENSRFKEFAGSCSCLATQGTYSVTIRDCSGYADNTPLSSISLFESADNSASVGGNVELTLIRTNVSGNVYSANRSNNCYNVTVAGDIITSITNCKIGGTLAAGHQAGSGRNAATKGDSLVSAKNVQLTLTGSSVATVHGTSLEYSGSTYSSRSLIGGSVTLNLSGSTVGTLDLLNAGTVSAGACLNLTGSGNSIGKLTTNANGALLLNESGIHFSITGDTDAVIKTLVCTQETAFADSTLTGSNLTITSGDLYAGALTLDDSTITSGGVINATSTNVTVNITDATITKIVDGAEGGSFGEITVSGVQGGAAAATGTGDLIAYNAEAKRDALYVNSEWATHSVGDEIVVDGKTVYYGVNAFADITSANNAAADNASLTIAGGSFAALSKGNFGSVTLIAGATVTSFNADTKGLPITFKYGATLETAEWGGAAITIDLQGVSADGDHVLKAIDYTGSGSVEYGAVVISNGGTKSGGYVFENDLSVCTKMVYNNPAYATTAPTSIVINGATFAVGTNYLSKKVQIDIKDYTSKNQTELFLVTGSGYTISSSKADEGSFYAPAVIYNADYNPASGTIHLRKSAVGKDAVVLVQGLTIANGLNTTHGTSSKSLTVVVTGSTFQSFYGSRSDVDCTAGDYSVIIRDCVVNGSGSNNTLRMISSAGSATAVNFNFTIENTNAGDVSAGNPSSNDYSSTVSGDIRTVIRNSSIASLNAASITANPEVIKKDSVITGYKNTIQKTNGNVVASISDCTVANLYGMTKDTSLVFNEVTYTGTAIVGGSICFNLSNTTVTGNVVPAAGGTIKQGVWYDFEDTIIGGTIFGDTGMKEFNGGFHMTLSGTDSIAKLDSALSFADVNVTTDADVTIAAGVLTVADLTVAGGVQLKVAAGTTVTNSLTVNVNADDTNKITIIKDLTFAGEVTVTGDIASSYATVKSGSDFVAYATDGLSSLYVNSTWSGELGDAITLDDGTIVYFGVNAFNSISDASTHATDNASLTIAGGSYSVLEMGKFSSITFTDDNVTVDTWGDDLDFTVKQGVTISTGSWNSKTDFTVELSGATAVSRLIDYTGTAAPDYGNIVFSNGGTAAGGFVNDKDLYIGSEVIYATKEALTTEGIAINGATFALNEVNHVTIGDETLAQLPYQEALKGGYVVGGR